MWRERQTDYEFLMSPETHDLIRQEGIAVIDYRTIQQAWRQKTAHRADTSTSQDY
jgi:hypothetical protein